MYTEPSLRPAAGLPVNPLLRRLPGRGALVLLCAVGALSASAQVTAVKRAVEGAEMAITGARAARAVRGLGAINGALPDAEIAGLAAKCKHVGGLEEVGQVLGREALGNSQLEDAYLRMAIVNGRLDKSVAETVFNNLSGTPGLRTLARKINSVSEIQAKGHKQELLIGMSARQRGLQVLEFGRRFDDGVKRAATDIDIVLSKQGRQLAIESKAYEADVPMDIIRQDSVSLVEFCKQNPATKPVFCFRNPPSAAVQRELNRRSVECVAGDADEIAAQLERLVDL